MMQYEKSSLHYEGDELNNQMGRGGGHAAAEDILADDSRQVRELLNNRMM
jgi:hypothetical protein